ncbi:MAG: hypothetical protein EA402_06465 [Planctomycetota bacterium]|nr:MAG: hypothetical protein EA402_06465 [Planctomycetota bacterium]
MSTTLPFEQAAAVPCPHTVGGLSFAMRTHTLLQLFAAWNAVGLRYIVVGGYAVIAHGHLRSTHDLDVVIDFAADQPQRLLSVLSDMHFVPRAPVPLADFADADKRRHWVEHMEAEVFSVRRQGDGGLPDEIDIFLRHPFSFAAAYAEALVQELPGPTPVRFVDRQRLITMKRAAGRARDYEDLAALEELS